MTTIDDVKLTQVFQMHARLQGGHLYSYKIMHGDRVIGSWSTQTTSRKGLHKTVTQFLLGTGPDAREYATAARLKYAYVDRLRGEEFDAAAPNKESES